MVAVAGQPSRTPSKNLPRQSCPLVAAFRFHDICDNHHSCFIGDAGGWLYRNLLREADTIIAINIRFGEMTTDGYACSTRQMSHNRSTATFDAELGKIYIADLPLQASRGVGQSPCVL